MVEQVAQFRFLRYIIRKSIIEICEGTPINQDLNVEFTQTSGVAEKECLYRHTLIAKIGNKGDSIYIEVSADGIFEFDKDLTDEQKASFFNINAPSILFPYIRAYITTLTSLSGIDPIILPTLNLSIR